MDWNRFWDIRIGHCPQWVTGFKWKPRDKPQLQGWVLLGHLCLERSLFPCVFLQFTFTQR